MKIVDLQQDKLSTKDVLKMVGVGSLVVASLAVPVAPLAAALVSKYWKNYSKRDLGRIIKRLDKQKMISISATGTETRIEITTDGKRQLLKYDYETIVLRKKSDGKWRLVIFDIPEPQKKNRDALRRKLIELGFIRLQDSVFASAYPCRKEIDFICHYLEVSDYVTLAVVDHIERGEKLLFRKIVPDV